MNDEQHEPKLLLESFGLAAIDEIHFKDVLGRSESFCTAGTRLFCNGPTSECITWNVHAGEDFPSKVETDLSRWRVNLSI